MDYNTQRERNDGLVRLAKALTQAIAGILILAIGIIFIDDDNFGIKRIQKFVGDREPVLMVMFGGICCLYGVWRLYRAYRTYKDEE